MRRTPLGPIGWGLVLALWMVAGCAKPPLVTPPPPVPEREWMDQESGAHRTGAGRVFYGIGEAAGLRNVSLLRASADNEARSEMARVLGMYVNALAEAAGFQSGDETDRQPLAALTKTALQRAHIVDHWFDAPSGTFKALCRLDLEQFQAALRSEAQLDVRLRLQMLSLADQVHHRLSGRPQP